MKTVLFCMGILLWGMVGMGFAQGFQNVASSVHVDDGSGSSGVTWGDYDNDGDLDLYLSNAQGPNKLYKNEGESFTDVAGSANVNASGSNAAYWGDFNNDGNLDLYLVNQNHPNLLYRNDGDETFTDIGSSALVDDSHSGQAAGWGDYDNDGDLDLYLYNYGTANLLFKNDGAESFSEVGSTAQVDFGGNGFGMAWADYDDDGDLDLYIVNEHSMNKLYQNQGNETFTDVASAVGVYDNGGGRGGSWADYDNDGDLDLYVTNFNGGPNLLYRNNGNGTSFTNVGYPAGVDDDQESHGAMWGDYDNDGDLDLYVANYSTNNRLFKNNGNGTFGNVAGSLSVDDGAGVHSYSVSWGDYDGDGDLDLYLVNFAAANRLYMNTGNANQWLHVGLVGTVSNKSGIGARVTAIAGSTQQRRELNGGGGLFSQSFQPVEFGLGSEMVVDELRVEWPSGIVQTLTNVSTNQYLTLVEIPTIDVSAPHVTATYNQELQIPVQVTDTSGGGIVSAEVFVSYDGDLLTAFSTGLTGTLAASGWSAETNIVEGNGTAIDTVKIAMATDNDVLSGAGTLIYIDLQMGNVRIPASSPLTLEHVLFNDGTPPNTTTDGSVTLVGVDGSIAHDPTEIIPREDIAVMVTDADENWDINAQDSFVVRVSNGSQSETLTVQETGNSTGIFEGIISTVFSLGATSDDDVVQAKAGDVIQSCYDDWLDADGITVERCDDTNVIGGTDGAIQVTIVSQPGDTVRVRVTDADLNINPGAQENAQVTATNPSTGESETIDLDEDGDNSDVFFGLLFTAPGSAAGAPDDATLNTAKGDVLDVTYIDVVTEQGGTEDLTDDDEVVDPFGDADGNGSVQAFDAAKVLLHALTPYLTGLDSLSANLDLLAFDPVHGKVTHFDASLILQKRVGKIGRFPVQEDEADNHPQPETDDSTPKSILDERLLSLQVHDGYLSVWMDEREEIISGELVVEGISGEVEMGAELSGFLSASRGTAEGLRIVFAGASPVEGSGELLRIHSGVGPGNVRLTRARFNDGGIVGWNGGTDLAEAIPQRFALHPNVPNPFNPATTIRFELPQESPARLEVFDMLGQRVVILAAGTLPRGVHEAVWDGRDGAGAQVSSGLYLYRLQAGDFEKVRRMLLLK
jgi:enediyne biosynthesis protein E4